MKSNLKRNRIAAEDGFLLVEILVAITITTILIGFAFGIYLFAQRFFLQWQNQLFLQNELHTLSHGITEELFRADRIINLESHQFVLKSDGVEKKYEVRGDSLFSDNQNLLNRSLSLVNFNLSAKDNEGKDIGEPDPKKIGDIGFVKFTLALTNGTDTLSTTRSIHLRKPSNWNTLTNNQ